ncbi:MAG: glycosyltransferase involved in cell wall biosynthesis [Lysobacterales bacterium]|jgi:glycosyltransferase involved in cell wall biosynthesis
MINKNISVVIPAYNCAHIIKKVIKALLNQTVPFKEIIIVDDGSTDNTADVIKSFPEVIYVHQSNAGPAKARNTGFHKSVGDYVFFTDSDCVAYEDWIEKAMVHFDDLNVSVVAGSYGIANDDSVLARCIHAEIRYRHEKLMPCNPKAFGSYNFGVRREIFEKVGGFNEEYRHASGEDNDLSYKIGALRGKIYFEKDALVGHFHTTKVWKYLKEQYRHGFWRVKMYKTHPNMMKGDDYTFWKDIIEPPIGLIIIGLFLLSVFGLGSENVGKYALMSLILMEIVFGWLFIRRFFEGVYYGFVMLLRSFGRLFGFLIGITLVVLFKKFK